MTGDPVALALVALLLPAAAFGVIGVLPPLRRAGRVAAVFSISCAATAFIFAVLAWRAVQETGTVPVSGSETGTVPVFR